ncbi:MAG: hydantoinase B/oxoprolinase family protein [Alphaproteobacteria bacterium]|nr:hydantoinase B/oxoprolinase family protein [Alphaproteobacteria bacterium]
MQEFDAVSLKIMWDRLVSIADEIVLSLVRTSFSINVREGYDLTCVLFDARGRTLAQGTYSVPSFCGTAPQTLQHMLRRYPAETLRPGDVVMTNDPWMGTGHLYDINVMRPVFRGDKLVGFTMSVTHLPDIGGVGFSATPVEVYAEGFRMPVVKLMHAGKLNEELLELFRFNVRVPDENVGDLMANVTCNEVGGRALLDFMDEYGIDDLSPLSDAIQEQSARAMREELLKIPNGVYKNAVDIEGIDEPIRLAATVKVNDGRVAIDFEGTSGPVRGAINVPICYTRAFSYYVVKCLTIPTLPNNEGAVRAIDVTAPQNCVLNCEPPWPTGGRHAVGHFVVPLLMGAFAQAVPERVITEPAMMTVFSVQGKNREGHDISSLFFLAGGFGAAKGTDGLSVTPAPSNMTVVPSEVWENLTGIVVERREMLADSGGPGEFRGGVGQEVVFRNDTGHLLTVGFVGQRTQFPARGLFGGQWGAKRTYFVNGKPVHPKGRHVLQPGDRFSTHEAGAGGYGDPLKRPLERVLADCREGLVTVEGAKRDYGVQVDARSGGGQRIATAAQ